MVEDIPCESSFENGYLGYMVYHVVHRRNTDLRETLVILLPF